MSDKCPVCGENSSYLLNQGGWAYSCGATSFYAMGCKRAARLATERAAEIERLRARVAELEDALRLALHVRDTQVEAALK